MKKTALEDLELIKEIKGGDKTAFKKLVDKYKKRAYSIICSIVNDKEESKDILQEAFVRTFYSIRSFREDSSFYSWFYRIVMNLCKDHIRRKPRALYSIDQTIEDSSGNEFKSIELKDNKEDPAHRSVSKEMGYMIQIALLRLPARQRMVFVLKWTRGLSLQEISDSLGLNISTCKVHLFRAMRALRKELDPYYRNMEV